jgi:hypothetical protein
VAGSTGDEHGSHFLVARFLSKLELGTQDFSASFNSILTYPNPISTTTTIRLNLDKPSEVAIQLYDLSGNLISNLLNTLIPEGTSQHELNLPSDIPPGQYFLKVQATGRFSTIKIIKQ